MKIDFEKFDISTSALEHLIDEWIFSERDRRALKLKYIDGLTFEQTAEMLDLSVRHTKTIVYKAEEKLFRHI